MMIGDTQAYSNLDPFVINYPYIFYWLNHLDPFHVYKFTGVLVG